MPRPRSAFTLLEVVIAAALFLIAAAAVMDSMVATRHLSSVGASKDQIELDASTIFRTMAADFALSGWEFAEPNETTSYAPVGTAEDRTLRYYPSVQVPAIAQGGDHAFPWAALLPQFAAIPELPEVLLGDRADANTGMPPLTEEAWQRSFHARSTAIIFLRAAVGSWVEGQDPGTVRDESVFRTIAPDRYVQLRPSEIQPPSLNFGIDANGLETSWEDWRQPGQHDRLGVLFTSGFREESGAWVQRFPDQPYGVTLDGGWYDWTDTEDAPIKPAWESMRKADVSAVPTATRHEWLRSPQRYREFMYVVVPSPTALGLGRLVRAYRRPDAGSIPVGVDIGQRITASANDAGTFATEEVAMVVDRVLSDDVVRVVFDTYRTVDPLAGRVTTLGINQVRVRLYLARRQVTNPDNILSRIVETTFSMRSRSSGGDMQNISATLGATPIGLER